MKNRTVTPALVVLVLNLALGVACTLLPPVVMGFLSLLRDVLGVLILPFSFLFGLAGWSTDLSYVAGGGTGFMPDSLRHPFRAIGAAGLLAFSVVCSVTACNVPEGAWTERIAAPVMTLAALLLVGWDPGLILLPALALQMYALRYPTMQLPGRRA